MNVAYFTLFAVMLLSVVFRNQGLLSGAPEQHNWFALLGAVGFLQLYLAAQEIYFLAEAFRVLSDLYGLEMYAVKLIIYYSLVAGFRLGVIFSIVKHIRRLTGASHQPSMALPVVRMVPQQYGGPPQYAMTQPHHPQPPPANHNGMVVMYAANQNGQPDNLI